MISIPTRARLVFGLRWGGWTWLSVSNQGRIIRWLFYFVQGDDEQRMVFFQREQDFEQTCDMLDFAATED